VLRGGGGRGQGLRAPLLRRGRGARRGLPDVQPVTDPVTAPVASDSAREEADRRILALERPHRNLLVLYTLQAALGLFLFPFIFVPLYFRYHTLRYRFDAEGVGVSWGILFRREVVLTYRRIQDIHVKRNLIERWLGIGTVEVQTASGSAKAELSVEGVEDHEALRDFLYRRMRGHAPGAAPARAKETSGVTLARAAIPAGSGDGEGAEALELLRAIRDELTAARAVLEQRC